MEVLARALQNPVVTLVLGILASGVVGYFFYRRGLRLKEPCWAIRSNNLVAGFTATYPLLEIRYKDAKVENLTVSKVLFWNHGADTIHVKDIAEADPLRLVGVAGTKILDVNLLATNSEPSRFLRPAPSADKPRRS
jgi:hypothetical protein